MKLFQEQPQPCAPSRIENSNCDHASRRLHAGRSTISTIPADQFTEPEAIVSTGRPANTHGQAAPLEAA